MKASGKFPTVISSQRPSINIASSTINCDLAKRPAAKKSGLWYNDYWISVAGKEIPVVRIPPNAANATEVVVVQVEVGFTSPILGSDPISADVFVTHVLAVPFHSVSVVKLFKARR
jgi:hypothetical protein